MKKLLAEYILALNNAAKATHYTADRPIYQMYLVEAGVLLALLEKETTKETLTEAMSAHECLRGNTWLQDPIFQESSTIWEKIKKQI
jgi:hypothetical protein